MSPRLVLAPLTIALFVLAGAGTTSAQVGGEVELTLGVVTGPATPGGDAVLIPVTFSYACETLWKAQTKITVMANESDPSVAAEPEDATFDPVRAPTCTPGASVTHTTNITVSVAADTMLRAGSAPEITVIVSGTNQVDEPIATNKTTTVEVAPLVAVAFTTNETALLAEQGELVTILIDATSTSNDIVTLTTTIPDWNLSDTAPDVLEVALQVPDDNESGMNQIEIAFEVPDDTEPGVHNFTVQLTATPEGDRTKATIENISYQLTVTEKKGDGGGGKDSPGPMLPALILSMVALAGVLRRRR